MLGNWLQVLYKYHPSLNNQPKPSDYPPQAPPQVGLTDLRNRIPNRPVAQVDARNLLRPNAQTVIRPTIAQPAYRGNPHRRNIYANPSQGPSQNPSQGFNFRRGRGRQPRFHRGYFNPQQAPQQPEEQQGPDHGHFRQN